MPGALDAPWSLSFSSGIADLPRTREQSINRPNILLRFRVFRVRVRVFRVRVRVKVRVSTTLTHRNPNPNP